MRPDPATDIDNPLPRVAILLATYNGIDFIADQIESILNQTSCRLKIWISDDQSTDGTWEWAREKSIADPRISLLPRESRRYGNAARNFYRLLCDVDFSEYDCVALSDQDDIWFSNKLCLCIREMRERGAAAVSSNVVAMWPNGDRKLIRKSQRQRRLDFLFESAGPGCTYVMTAECIGEFKEFLAAHRGEIEAIQFHDWMLYAWARSNGFTWHVLPYPTMFYRQHDRNEYGANSGWSAFLRRLAQVRFGWYREQILQISRLVRDGSTFTTECGAIVRLVERRTLASRIALIMKVSELRRRAMDRAWLALACLLGGI